MPFENHFRNNKKKKHLLYHIKIVKCAQKQQYIVGAFKFGRNLQHLMAFKFDVMMLLASAGCVDQHEKWQKEEEDEEAEAEEQASRRSRQNNENK